MVLLGGGGRHRPVIRLVFFLSLLHGSCSLISHRMKQNGQGHAGLLRLALLLCLIGWLLVLLDTVTR